MMSEATTKARPDTSRKTEKMSLAVSSASAPTFVKGRRDFFTYRDLGVTAGSNGRVRAQVTAATAGMSKPTGWHYHVCEAQFVYMLKGWIELEFADRPTLKLQAGDSIFIPGGLPHNEIRTSDAFELLEVSVPADMGTESCPAPKGR
jgi:quercetin dioxygenase-like cupin family protein